MSIKSVPNVDIQDEGSILSFYPAQNDAGTDEEIVEENFIKYENTYRMESKNPFNEVKALAVVQNEIEKCLNAETKYDPYKASKLCADMSLNIRNSIYGMHFERYKIVCIVEIGEKKDHGVLSVVRFLRDSKRDKYVNSSFENNDLFATVCVGALYYE